MFGHRACIVASVLVLAQAHSISRAASVVERCAEAIAKIRSYDATFSVEHLNFPNVKDVQAAELPVTTYTDTTRDVFAFGLGRRVEEHVGSPSHSISVISWATAGSSGSPQHKSLPVRIAYSVEGSGYLEFIDPNCWGIFLVDLLRDRKSTILPLEPDSSRPNQKGFEVVHPRMTRPVRLWVDAEHGYMPSVIEKYVRNGKGEMKLWSVTKVEKFLRTAEGVWVPVEGSHQLRSGIAQNSGTPYTGTRLSIDVARSSWNSIDSGELFLPESLQQVNYVREDGYKQYLPPSTLAGVLQAEQSMKDVRARALRSQVGYHRVLLLALNVMVVVALVALIVWRRHRKRRIATGN